MDDPKPEVDVVVIGAGFTGLSAAYELAKAGATVKVLEAERDLGGLAGAFDVGGSKLDRFYHHWFTNDADAMRLIDELGLRSRVSLNATSTGIYYANRRFKLSTPFDLLRLSALPFVDRLRLGLLAWRARHVRDWRVLERKSAREWLRELGGDTVYRIVWEPLLAGKFGPYAGDVSAVWIWNKLKLRGSSRGKAGEERLAYFQGGFVALAEAMAERIRSLGGEILTSTAASSIQPEGENWTVAHTGGRTTSRKVLSTVALPLTADLVAGWAESRYLAALRRIQYLANVCLVLELDRSLSSTYWLNVNDPSFPFVGVIEHTNLERPERYGGRHIVYLSKYLPADDALYGMTPDEMLAFALPHLRRMFPHMEHGWVKAHHVWRARWAQPVVERNYSAMIPAADGPKPGFHLCSMAQIYPEDRGTNYAIREGRKIGERLARALAGPS